MTMLDQPGLNLRSPWTQQPSPEELQSFAAATARKYGLDPQISARQTGQESGGRHWDASGNVITSPAGAIGYSQLMPATAKALGVDPYDPYQNIEGGLRYQKQMLSYFGGDQRKATAAYDAGPGGVEQAQRVGGANWEDALPDETKQYLAAILGGGVSSKPRSPWDALMQYDQKIKPPNTGDAGLSSGYNGIRPPGIDPTVHPQDISPPGVDPSVHPGDSGFRDTGSDYGDVPVGSGADAGSLSRSRLQNAADNLAGGGLRGIYDAASSDLPFKDQLRSSVQGFLQSQTPLGALDVVREGVNRAAGIDLPQPSDVVAGIAAPRSYLDLGLGLLPGNGASKEAGSVTRAGEDLLSIIGKAGAAGKASQAALDYKKLIAGGFTDEDIVKAFGQSALDLAKGGKPTAQAVGAATEITTQAQSRAARNVYNQVLKDTGSVEMATDAARKAAGNEAGATKRLRNTASELSDRMGPGVIDSGASAGSGALVPAGEALTVSGERAPQTAAEISARLADEADRIAREGLSPKSSDTLAELATAAKRLGDPASEIRRQLQQGGGEPDTVNAARGNEYADAAKAERQARQDEANALRVAGKTQIASEVEQRAAEIDRLRQANAAAVQANRGAIDEGLAMAAGKTPQDIADTATKGGNVFKDAAQTEREAARAEPIAQREAQQAEAQAAEASRQAEIERLRNYNRGIVVGGRQTTDEALAAIAAKTPVEEAVQGTHWNLLHEAMGALGVPQTIMASSDIGQIGRQAQVLGWSNPREYADAVKQGAKAYLSEAATKAANDAVKASPAYDLAQKSGLHFYEAGEGVASAERVPGFGGLGRDSNISKALGSLGPVKASERSLATSLNVQGMQVFEKYANGMAGADEKQLKSLANVINHARGYGTGDLAQMLSSTNTFFSARNMVAKFQVLMDPFTAAGSLFEPSARQLAAKNLAAFISGQAAMMGFLGVTGAAAGGAWSVNADPRAGDFGQLRIGNTRIDTFAGFGPVAKLLARTGSEAVDAVAGTDLAKPNADWRQALVGFFRNKEAPVPGLITSILSKTDNLGQPFKVTPELAAQMFLPFILNDVREAVLNNDGANKLLAAPTAVASMIGLGTQSYPPTTTELRDNAARKLGADDYQSAMPSVKQQIDAMPAIAKARAENVSESQQFSLDQHAPIKAEVDRQETLFSQNKNTTQLRDVYHDATQRNIQAAVDFSLQYGSTFSNLPQSEQQKALREYYAIDPKVPEGEANAGGTDVDKQASDRLDYIKAHPEYADFIKQSLQVSENNKTPLHQNYDSYIAAKKAAGYFDIKPDDPKAAEKRAALDKANPALDVASWYFGGTADKPGSGVNTITAADMALQHYPDRPVVLSGYSRPINETPGVKAIYDGTKGVLNDYANAIANPANLDAEADRIRRGAKFNDLTKQQQSEAKSSLTRALQRDHPDLDATLAFFGKNETLGSARAKEILDGMIAHAGIKDPGKDKVLSKVTVSR